MSIAERVRGDELFAARATEIKRVLMASKATLATTIVIMGLGAFLIGLLATYQQQRRSCWPCCGLFQGSGLGGKWGGLC